MWGISLTCTVTGIPLLGSWAVFKITLVDDSLGDYNITNILAMIIIHERGIPFSTNHWTWVYIVNDLWPWVPHHPDVLLFEFPLYPSVAINIGCSMLTPFYCIENVAILSLSFKPSPAWYPSSHYQIAYVEVSQVMEVIIQCYYSS